MKTEKILSQLVEQFQQKHGRLPEKILVHPAAAVVLSFRKSLAPTWKGVPVVCEAVKPVDLGAAPATKLGVTVYKDLLQGFDL